MLSPPLSLLALCFAIASSPVLAATAGSFVDGGDTLVSAMMMFVGNSQRVYILDKAEGNAAQVAGHPAWGSVWDIDSHQAQVMDIRTNTFCSSGFHLPNGSYITLGGNGAIGPNGNIGSQKNPDQVSGAWDSVYQDFDGAKAIRILDPCTRDQDINSPACTWFDDPTILSMQRKRWYSSAEGLADGSIIILGGFVNGGYVNRNFPNTDPEFSGGAAENTIEFYPSRGPPMRSPFLIGASGLNAYAHAFLMPSGKIFMQANVSTTLLDPDTGTETDLPPMPHGVVRVYPASGAVAMLPLTPANNYVPTILFCGGQEMPPDAYGNYAVPAVNTWEFPASTDCQRITPEPTDGSPVTYTQDDDMMEGRTMGQFIILPNGKLFIVNGGLNGTAGYAQFTGQTASFGDMPFGESLASGPVLTPAIYDPLAPAGKRWSRDNLGSSTIPRLYHSSATLLPDGSVLIAGSNPNIDVNTSTIFPTTYKAEIFFPSYFSAPTRPTVTGAPTTLSYGGSYFNISVSATSYSGSANDAADKTTVVIHRSGFTTHAMNMGQRLMQLNNTYTVNSDGSITLHVSQPPPNPNLYSPGPAFLYVVIDGIPSNGSYLIVGNGQMGTQPTAPASVLPDSVRVSSVSGAAPSGNNDSGGAASGDQNTATSGSTTHTGVIVGAVVGAIAILGIIGALIGVYLARRRRALMRDTPSTHYPMTGGVGGAAAALGSRGTRISDSSPFVPLQQDNHSHAWNASSTSLSGPYRDDIAVDGRNGSGMSMEYDPYTRTPMQSNGTPQYRY